MLEYLVTAAVSCSVGVVIGGLVSSAKIGDLYERIALAERTLEEQTDLVKNLTNTMREFLGAFDARMVNGIGPDALSAAQSSLAKSDAFLHRMERERSEAG